MITNAIQNLSAQATRATQDLSKIRTEITRQFDNDYVVGTMTMERLIQAQHSVGAWAKIVRALSAGQSVEQQVQALRGWVASTSERLLDTGRSSSTSLVANASTLSEEEAEKEVLRAVKQVISYADKQS